MMSPQLQTAAMITLVALCHDCRQRHEIAASPATWLARLDEWRVKHAGHRFEFVTPRRTLARRLADRLIYPLLDRWGALPWWLAYAENADIKLAYAASAAYTLGLEATPLGSSTTFVAGRESTAVANTTDKYLDYLIGGKVTTGTSPTAAKSIRIYAHGAVDDTPTYVDVLDGTDSDETLTSTDFLNQLALLATLGTDNTSNRTYWMQPKALSLAFGGVVPTHHGLFVAHDTGVALNATGSNHAFKRTGLYATG
jgi:hypothetical protein